MRPRPRPCRRFCSAPAVGALALLSAALAEAFAQAPPSPAPAASAASSPALVLRRAARLDAPPGGEAGRDLPVILRARTLGGRPDLDAVAEGDVEFRRGDVVVRADRLTYDQAEDLARATGNVVVSRDGTVFRGPELQLRVQRFEGFFREPSYFFSRTGAGGSAARIDFLDEQRAIATDASYSSCPSDGSGDPAWLLTASEIRIDNEANEGFARGAVLRFLGVPILAAPILSFPLSDARKSGFLPPSFGLDSTSGIHAAIPYYWNIAPNRDATFTPSVLQRRGAALEAELRYLEPRYAGEAGIKWMPRDELAGRERHALRFAHDGLLPWDTLVQARVLRVSDDDYWKDFPRELPTLTPRLLPTDVQLARPFGSWQTYARVQRWQALQTADPSTRFVPPYERLPQVGLRYAEPAPFGVEVGLESEFNRFADARSSYQASRQTGVRLHALGSLARPYTTPGWTLVPAVSFNAASYALDRPLVDGSRNRSRLIPTLSVDSAWTLERDTRFFGRAVRQTLEPRLLYVNTPYVAQQGLPNFDSAAKDFNFDSIFTPSAFSGVDRVSDAHQLTAGVVSRVLDADTGAERLRLGIVQRYLFRDQRITPDGQPLTRRFSDVIALGSTTLVPNWAFDASVQWNPENARIDRSIAGVRWSPGPFRTVNFNYRLARGLSEQVELGWQWPVYGPVRSGTRAANLAVGGAGRACNGTLYSVGRVNYSTRDSRITDAIVGFEYDAGCWIMRVVGERLSTGRSEQTTRLLVQLELVGLSRLGSNPLQALKENIPGYQLLRDDRPAVTPYTPYLPP